MSRGIYDWDRSNVFLDQGEEEVAARAIEDVTIRDPVVLMKRLKEITTPKEQMLHFLKSIIDPTELHATHEGRWTRIMAASGLVCGWLFGGLSKSSHLHEEYIRQHNASVFDHHYRAKRHMYDTFVFKIMRRGLGPGVKTGLLCLATGFISFGSITYRGGCLYYPDWALGFASLGALSRTWLGTRGIVGGAVMGFIAGNLGYGLARSAELISGKSVAELRYEQEMDYLRRHELIGDRLRRQREGWVKEMMTKTE